MTSRQIKTETLTLLIPTFGAIIFVIFYLVAATLYPGGSYVDREAEGFSWVNNYWCNLLKSYAINGQDNKAQPIAMIGMFILCIALSIFWYLFPKYIKLHPVLRLITSYSGALAMILAFLLNTDLNHDSLVIAAGFSGLVAMLGTFVGLISRNWYGLLYFGFVNLVLLWLNNYLYFSENDIHFLPIVQKITFASFLLWVCYIDISLYYLRMEDFNRKLFKGRKK